MCGMVSFNVFRVRLTPTAQRKQVLGWSDLVDALINEQHPPAKGILSGAPQQADPNCEDAYDKTPLSKVTKTTDHSAEQPFTKAPALRKQASEYGHARCVQILLAAEVRAVGWAESMNLS